MHVESRQLKKCKYKYFLDKNICREILNTGTQMRVNISTLYK